MEPIAKAILQAERFIIPTPPKLLAS